MGTSPRTKPTPTNLVVAPLTRPMDFQITPVFQMGFHSSTRGCVGSLQPRAPYNHIHLSVCSLILVAHPREVVTEAWHCHEKRVIHMQSYKAKVMEILHRGTQSVLCSARLFGRCRGHPKVPFHGTKRLVSACKLGCGQRCAQEQGLGWDGFQSTVSLVGHNQSPVLSPTPRSTPLPNLTLSIALPGAGCYIQGGRCCTLPPAKSHSSRSSFSQGSHNITHHGSSKSPPEPSTSPRHQCRSVGKVTAHPRSRPSTPIAAHQHAPIWGLYFRSRLPRAKYLRTIFLGVSKKHELAPQQQRGKEERQNREPTWCNSKHLKPGLTVLNDDLDESNRTIPSFGKKVP